MIDALFNQPGYVGAKKMLDATVLQHEAIASNLANLGTPNYKRLDVAPAFATSLSQAMRSQDASRMASLNPELAVDASATGSSGDGNTVQLDTELIHLNKNSMEHTLETQLVTASLLRLRTAITGRS